MRSLVASVLLVVPALAGARPADLPVAAPAPASEPAPAIEPAPVSEPASAPAAEAPSLGLTVVDEGPTALLPEGRARSEVRRSDLERRLPRSAPDALRYEPGVYVQQTGHGQGSAFLRGLTGQQTLLLFDGIRLNNSTYRQGPNQYFFTLDSQTLDSIEVLRGGASTVFGSDALGGVILAHPIEPSLAPAPERGVALGPVVLRPRVAGRATTADDEYGGRAQLELAGGSFGFVGGVGARDVGLLESAGPIEGLDGLPPLVPLFADDGRTQLGTGFQELTFDGRAVALLGDHRLTLAGYGYRQYDAPRTDQCPPAYAPEDDCLVYEEQFRTLAYVAWDGALGAALPEVRATLSFQNQHERRRQDRPRAFVEGLGRDDVDTLGASLRGTSAWAEVASWLRLRATAGADHYQDRVASKQFLTFTDVDITLERTRGQYLDGSTYATGGAFLDGEAELVSTLTVRAGGRLAWIDAEAAADPVSGSAPVDQQWTPVVGHAGLEWRPLEPLALVANLDRSFRAPNLDDLTSRQQTGPGFQFENATLQPEVARTVELGARLRTFRVEAEAWVFRTTIEDAMVRRSMTLEECPPETPQCAASWNRFQLVNVDGESRIDGAEGALRLRLPLHLVARATISWAFGEGPNPQPPPDDPSLPFEERLPLSRIPPLNGTAELDHRNPLGFAVGAALRWADAQDRLALNDLTDARIPRGGTPGFAVLDVRASYRIDDRLAARVVLENLLDAPYRYHGSSVNGPGLGLTVAMEAAPF